MFWPRLKTVEQTADHTILKENPVYAAGVIPFAVSLMPVGMWVEFRDARGFGIFGDALALVAFTIFFATGLSTLVASTFCISRVAGTLAIKRKLLWWTIAKEYAANDILTVFEDRAIKGNRLMMWLRSGQVKRFAIYGVYAPVDVQAARVNSLLHEARLAGVQPPARNPLVH